MSEDRRWYLHADGVGLIVEQRAGRLPGVLHWGADPRPDPDDLAAIASAVRPALTSDTLDAEPQVSVVPEASAGWFGTPGLRGNRAGASFSPQFIVREAPDDPPDPAAAGGTLRWRAADDAAGLALVLELRLTPEGLLLARAELTNTGPTPYRLDGLDLALPVPDVATELLDHTGRHLLERQPQRSPFVRGIHLRESRRARIHDGTMLLAAGTARFGDRHGEVWGIHVGWSGNTRLAAECVQPGGVRLLSGGELLESGEIDLAPGDTYVTPWLWGSYGGHGLDELSGRFHRHLRARPEHPHSPRKVLLNVWEAVYFNHDLHRLKAIADAAAAVGVERFVLDDGWFHGRRRADAGLGDWWVDPEVWPDGLHPLVDHVRGLGMEFGLWFEPEMVNPDSDLARAHPDWILQPGDGRLPAPSRDQQVLDLAHPQAYATIRDAIDAILTAYDIGYVKWDHNRDLSEAGSLRTGRASVHEQTLAAYRLIDELRAAHPGVEFESCAGGGGRPDLGIMTRAERLWTSDTIDALERLTIQRGTELILPPEMLGAHIGAARSHTTSRTHDLSFRAASAVFHHLGLELDLTTLNAAELAELAGWIALYKDCRELFHTGTVVHAELPDGPDREPAVFIRGVVAPDGREAVFAVHQVRAGLAVPPGRARIPGLDPGVRYRVELLAPGDRVAPSKPVTSPWWQDGVTLGGATLATVGLLLPPQHPEHTVLIRFRESS